MKKDIIYKKPTDWEYCEGKREEWYKEWRDFYDGQFKGTKNSQYLWWTITAARIKTYDFICIDFIDGARECLKAIMECCEILLKKYNSKQHKKMSDEELLSTILSVRKIIEFCKWVLGENDIKNLEKAEIERTYNMGKSAKNYDKKDKRIRNKMIRCYLKYGYFDEARKLNDMQYKAKRITKLKTSDIYSRDKFFYYITEYLAENEKIRDSENDIKECFLYLFDEYLKGNKSVFEYDYNPECCLSEDYGFIYDMAYIWYKYFGEADFEKMTAIDIIKCRRYGLKL